MVWTREEVDKYVIQVERNCSSPRERNLKGFAFARLYREASDHDNARRYLEAYISESEGDFRGHRLMGQLYEEKGQLEKAVASYRRSLELNNTQKDLVLKVVKLYCTVPVHPDRARAWADRGARLFPGHADVFHLRLHLLETAESVDFEALEDLISEEVSTRPREVLLHIRLVKLYAVRGRLSEAFSHCVAVMKTKAFKDSLEWYRCCVDVFEKYVSSLEKHLMEGQVIGSGHTILEAHSFLLIALCQLLEQHLCGCDTRDVINVLYRLDHCLFMACNRKIRHSPRKLSSGVTTEWDVVLTEMKAQLYMHCGTLVIRLAKEKFVTWPRGLKLACACYLASIGISEPETKTPWVARAPKNKDPLKWYIMACSRLSRVGHFLMAANDRHGTNWLNTCHSDCCSRHGQEEILDTVYRNEKDSTKSFLANDGEFAFTEANLPEVDQLVAWDEVALSEDPRSLQSLIWVGLHWYQYDKEMRPGVGVIVKEIFRDLRMDVPNLEKHITPNMLCLRDLESFLYAVVRTAAARILEDRDIFYEDFEPRVLPVPLCSSLSLPVQEEWWVAAYSLYTGKFSLSESGKTRRIVQLGIEKIRAVDLTHGLQVQLLIYLAKAFGTKASFLKSSGPNPWYYEEHWKSLERWSLHYWQRAIIILEMLEKDESIPHCTKPLFPRLFDALQESDVKLHLQSACLVLGGSAMKEGRIEEAMELFEQVKTPPGMFNLAQIYKYLAHVEARAATEETDTECTGPAQEYYENLKKARELLLAYMKMTDSSDVGRQAVMDELNEIESMIKIGVTHANLQSGTHMRQLSDPESRSSTYVSDVQESEDNFWVEQPQDSSTKDLIAKLSEVTLNNGYLQEQMAIRDETMATMSDQISFLQDELCKLQTAYFGQSPLTGPSSSNQSSTEQNKPVFESTPIAARQASTAKGPRSSAHSAIKGPLKIDAGFFAGLSLSNSPDVRVEESQEEVYSPVSPGRDRHDSSTSYTEDIHFEPLIPLPEQIELQTGEEDEEVMFDSRAKLYRYDKDVSAWKERGIGTLKILYCAGRHRCRILMRREIVHKICANHLITTDMKLTEKKETANSWIWNTVADFSDEVSKPEQLTVKFKTQEDSSLFKETFDECLNILEKEAPVIQGHPSTRAEKGIDLVAKFAPKPGSWTCSICLIMNEEHARICGACGAAKVSDDTPTSSLSPSHKPLPLLGFPSGVSGSAFMFPGLQTTASPSVPFTFGTSDQGKGEPQTDVTTSTFTFVAPDTSVSNEVPGAVVGSQVFGSSAGALPSGTQPLGFSPFKLLDSGSGTSPSKFVFGSSSMTGVSTSSSVPQTFPTTVASPSATRGVPSVFGGAIGQGTPISFGSLSTENSPVFNVNSLDISSSGTQTEPLVCEKCEGDNLVTQDATPQPPPQPSVSSSASVQQGMPEQKLFWEKPTGTFQFGQLEEIPPLGGAGAWPGYSNYWYPTQAAAAASGSGSPSSLGNQQTAGASPQPPIPTRFPQGNTSLATSQSLDEFATHSKFSGSELLRHLALAKVQQEALSQVTEDKGYDFTPYVVDEPALPSEATFLPKETKSASTLVVEEYDSENQVTDAANTAETDSSTDETSSYTSTETEDNLAEIEHEIESTMQKPPAQVAQLLPSVMLNQPAVMASPSRPVPFHSAEVMNAGPVPLPSQITGRRFLTARSPLRGAKKQDEDCVLVYEVRPSRSDRETASHLMLPTNFFNYAKREVCPGCHGCKKLASGAQTLKYEVEKEKPHSETPVSSVNEPRSRTGADPVFGQSSDFGQLTFSSFKSQDDSSFTEKTVSFKPFQGAGTQLFGEGNQDTDPDNLHFEPVIPLPDKIKVVTGEEGLEVLFSERAKLYRFDTDLSQWKERGVGDIKLLCNPKSGQGRVLMRREQIKKVCANHNITSGMELKPNVGSDRSWVWYTTADFAEDEPRPEKLAIRFKFTESAVKFKEIFDMLRDSAGAGPSPEKEGLNDQQKERCTLYEHFVSAFVPAPGVWSCEVCYLQNEVGDVACVACSSPQPATRSHALQSVAQASGVELVEAKAFEGTEESAAVLASSSLETSFASVLNNAPLFTIGRGESSDEKADEEVLSPSKISSPSKQHSTAEKPSTPLLQSNAAAGFPFGSNTPTKFTFSLQVSPGSPSRKPKSPPSPASPLSPKSPVYGEDDGPYFEPLIPLPEKIECRTGEEDEEELFCDRCKLYRYDMDSSQWKERGVGDIKILHHKSSAKYRVLMRREHVFKLCANHSISGEMLLKPFPSSDKAWLWKTLADFSEEVAKPETLAAKFRTNAIATEFKDVFDNVLQTLVTTHDEKGPKPKSAGPTPTLEKQKPDVGDVLIMYEQEVSEEQKEKAIRLQLPQHFFAYDKQSPETSHDQSLVFTSNPDQTSTDGAPEEGRTPRTSNFLFGSPNVASLSFQSVAASSLGTSPFGQKSPTGFAGQKSPGTPAGFAGAGSTLFSPQSPTDGDTDGPHFEPLIPLPEKIDVKTGEEDEEVMFSHRAKLYRFIAEDKQWKERGVGDIKLLKNKTSGRMRVLMRREQVKKLCANHQITEDMKLQPNAGSDRSWVWSTLADFSEQECRAERLAVRFKMDTTARQFKEKFEECQEMLKQQIPEGCKERVTEDIVTQFKPDAGSWECDTCLVMNNSDKTECAACGTHKPGAEPSQTQQTSGKPVFPFRAAASSSGSGFTFGFPGDSSGQKPTFCFGSLSQTSSSTSVSGPNQTQEKAADKEEVADDLLVKLKPSAGSWECDTCLVRNNSDKIECAACGTHKPGAEPTQAEQTSGKPVFPFGANTSSTGSGFKFGFLGDSGGQKPTFSFGSLSQTSSSTSASGSNQTQEKVADKEEVVEDLVTQFKPQTGSWECDTCMVRNNSDKAECAACGTLKPGSEPTQAQQTSGKPVFSFGAGTTSSDSGFKFGFSGDSKGKKPDFSFGALSQTSSSTPESTNGFDFAKQEAASGEDQSVEIKQDVSVSVKQSMNDEKGEVNLGEPSLESQSEEEVTQSVQDIGGSKEELASPEESETTQQDDAEVNKGFIFGSPNVASLSFQSVAASSLGTIPFGQKSPGTPAGFAGAGSTLFSPQSPGEDATDGDTEGPHFEPLIPLPEKIEVKTGEEDEEVLFSHRAKLYRFIAEDKQWKERGVGDIKLLKNKTSGRMRVLMRREQVKKLCANHQITEDMKLQPNAGSDRSWVWSTLADFSEQECRAERLAVRFKTDVPAKQFKEKFEECQEMLKQQIPEASKEHVAEDIVTQFKPDAGSWECDTCLVRNNSDKIECAACGTHKPGAEPSQAQQTSGKPVFPFGAGTTSSGSGFKFGLSGNHNGQNQTFTFGSLGQTSSSTSESASNQTQEKAANKEVEAEDLLVKLRPQAGSWDCDTCMVGNNSDTIKCAACGALKPGADPNQAEQTSDKHVFPFEAGTALSSFGANTSMSSLGAGTALSSFGAGTALSSFGAHTSLSGSGFNFDLLGQKQTFTSRSSSQTFSSTSTFSRQEASVSENRSVQAKKEVVVSMKKSAHYEKHEVKMESHSLKAQLDSATAALVTEAFAQDDIQEYHLVESAGPAGLPAPSSKEILLRKLSENQEEVVNRDDGDVNPEEKDASVEKKEDLEGEVREGQDS